MLKAPDVDAVLITHGTDTLEETSYFLSLVDQEHEAGGDGRLDAAGHGDLAPTARPTSTTASPRRSTRARRAAACWSSLNDEIHYARNVVKTDTTSLQTFASLNRGPAGLVHTGKVEWFQPMDKKQGPASEFSVDGLEKLPRVDILYAHANMSADLIDAAVKNGAQGLVVAGVGDGNMTTPGARRADEGREERRRGGAQHAPADGHRAAQQRGRTTTSSASSRRAS